CYKCGGINHYARDCRAGGIKCYNCNEIGHISRDCQNAPVNDRPAKICYRCNEPGHIARNCPNEEAQDASYADADADG
ncbi:hypothetical protein THASP1DRAFT_7322, partial [Thamnocephalis sphaerospora]